MKTSAAQSKNCLRSDTYGSRQKNKITAERFINQYARRYEESMQKDIILVPFNMDAIYALQVVSTLMCKLYSVGRKINP